MVHVSLLLPEDAPVEAKFSFNADNLKGFIPAPPKKKKKKGARGRASYESRRDGAGGGAASARHAAVVQSYAEAGQMHLDIDGEHRASRRYSYAGDDAPAYRLKRAVLPVAMSVQVPVRLPSVRDAVSARMPLSARLPARNGAPILPHVASSGAHIALATTGSLDRSAKAALDQKRVRKRMEALPNIVCRAANGDLYMLSMKRWNAPEEEGAEEEGPPVPPVKKLPPPSPPARKTVRKSLPQRGIGMDDDSDDGRPQWDISGPQIDPRRRERRVTRTTHYEAELPNGKVRALARQTEHHSNYDLSDDEYQVDSAFDSYDGVAGRIMRGAISANNTGSPLLEMAEFITNQRKLEERARKAAERKRLEEEEEKSTLLTKGKRISRKAYKASMRIGMLKELGVNFHDEKNPFSNDPADDGVTLHRADEYKLSMIGGERPRKKKKEDQDSDNSDNEWADLEIDSEDDSDDSEQEMAVSVCWELYIEVCKRLKIPMLSTCLKEMEHEYANMDYLYLKLKGTTALAATLPYNVSMRTLTLKGNNMGGDAIQLLVAGMVHNSSITSLDLSKNPLGDAGAIHLGELLSVENKKEQVLEELVMSECMVDDAGVAALAYCLSLGNETLRVLTLKKNKISDAGANELALLLQHCDCLNLQDLDLGWNNIGGQGAIALGMAIRVNCPLQRLSLEWNGLETKGGSYICSMLAFNNRLKELNLSTTRSGPEVCLVVCEALSQNTVLEALRLDGNPLGADGGRHLMWGLHTSKSLKTLTMKGSVFAAEGPVGNQSGYASLNMQHPDGHYKLDVAEPAQKAVARQLIIINKKMGHNNIQMCKINVKPVSSQELQDFFADGPEVGKVEFQFRSQFSKESVKQVVLARDKEINALLREFEDAHVSNSMRTALLTVISTNYFFTCSQALSILNTFDIGFEQVDAAVMCFMRTVDTENFDRVLNVLNDTSYAGVLRALDECVLFRYKNPTGFYRLDLSKVDTESENWRNVELNSTKLYNISKTPSSWAGVIPHSGWLQLDYVTLERNKGVKCMREREFQQVMVSLFGPNMNRCHHNRENIIQLRKLSVRFFISCEQVVRLLRGFTHPAARVEMVVTLYSRIVDQGDFWKVLYALESWEQALAFRRLGTTACYFSSRCSLHWILNTSNPTERQMAMHLCNKAVEETSMQSLHNLRIDGRSVKIREDKSLWQVILTSGSNPMLEFDFIGADWAQVLVRPGESVDRIKSDPVERESRNRITLVMSNTQYNMLHNYTSSVARIQRALSAPGFTGPSRAYGARMEFARMRSMQIALLTINPPSTKKEQQHVAAFIKIFEHFNMEAEVINPDEQAILRAASVLEERDQVAVFEDGEFIRMDLNYNSVIPFGPEAGSRQPSRQGSRGVSQQGSRGVSRQESRGMSRQGSTVQDGHGTDGSIRRLSSVPRISQVPNMEEITDMQMVPDTESAEESHNAAPHMEKLLESNARAALPRGGPANWHELGELSWQWQWKRWIKPIVDIDVELGKLEPVKEWMQDIKNLNTVQSTVPLASFDLVGTSLLNTLGKTMALPMLNALAILSGIKDPTIPLTAAVSLADTADIEIKGPDGEKLNPAMAVGYRKERVATHVELLWLLVYIAPMGGLGVNKFSAPVYSPPPNMPEYFRTTVREDRERKEAMLRAQLGSLGSRMDVSALAKAAVERVSKKGLLSKMPTKKRRGSAHDADADQAAVTAPANDQADEAPLAEAVSASEPQPASSSTS